LPKKPLEAIEEHFGKVRDPRKDWTKAYKLIDRFGIAICGVLCAVEGWVDFEIYGSDICRAPWITDVTPSKTCQIADTVYTDRNYVIQE
jgi:hypothetical protein